MTIRENRWNRFFWAVRAAALLAMLSTVRAQEVTSFDVFKLQLYNQTSSAQPATPNAAEFNARIFVSSPISAATSSVMAPSSVIYDLGKAGTVFQNPAFFGNEASMDATFGAGGYDFSLQSNDLGGGIVQTGTLTMPATNIYSASTPYFTNFTNLQSLNANQDFTFTWNAFATNPDASLSQTFFLVTDVTQSLTTVSQFFPDAVTSAYTVKGGTLIPGDSYTATVYFSSRTVVPGAWSGGANGLLGFDQVTSASFTPIPEPPAGAWMAGGVLGVVVLRRKLLAKAAARRGGG